MKKSKFVSTVLFFVLIFASCTNLSSNSESNKKTKTIDILKEEPTWAKNCQHIYIGDYMKSVVDESYKAQLIAIVANKYQKPTEKITDFTDFIVVSIDGVNKILKFYKIEKQDGKIKHSKWVYKDDVDEVILDFYKTNYTNSGVGDGGDFIFKQNNFVIYKVEFYAN